MYSGKTINVKLVFSMVDTLQTVTTEIKVELILQTVMAFNFSWRLPSSKSFEGLT